MLNIAFTFDYEIFFGENFGTYKEILFYPTNQLLEILEKYNVKATFFVDVLSVYMHNKYGLIEYCDQFSMQIKDMILKGHDVQLHIHSNWLKSKYEDGKWIFDIDSYRIHSFGFDELKEWPVQKIIKWGKEYLEKTITPIKNDYKCIAYRAGGYSIQPHKELFKTLINNNIFIDSSIAIGQKANYINEYDFTNISDVLGWWINPESDLNEIYEKNACAVYEVPIFYNKTSLIRKLFLPKTETGLKLDNIKGTYIGQKTNVQKRKIRNKLKALFNYSGTKRLLSVDSLPYQAIIRTLRKVPKDDSRVNTIAIIGHPKLIEQKWLGNFEELLKAFIKEKNIKAVTMFDMFNIKYNYGKKGLYNVK